MKFLMNTNKKLLLRPVTFFPHKHIIESSQAQNFLSGSRIVVTVFQHFVDIVKVTFHRCLSSCGNVLLNL